MTTTRLPDTAQFFETLCKLARLSSTMITDLHRLLNESLHVCLEELPLDGAVVWLRASEQDIITPGVSRLPSGYSTSAIAESHEILQEILNKGAVILDYEEAEPLLELTEGQALAITAIESEDALLGLVGYVADTTTLTVMIPFLEAHADILSAPALTAWLRREQTENQDVADTLFTFAGELRAQRSLEDIFSTLNNLALRVFNCDWSAVYIWDTRENQEQYNPVQIMTRIGQQSIDDEPSLRIQDNPILELVIADTEINSLRDLREQPTTLPVYQQRHGLRGLVLVPILHETNPMGLLALGYRTPLVPLSSRATALAQGLARLVGIALDRTRTRTSTS